MNRRIAAATAILAAAILLAVMVIVFAVKAKPAPDPTPNTEQPTTEQPSDAHREPTYFFFAEKKEGPYNYGHNAYLKAKEKADTEVLAYITDASFDKDALKQAKQQGDTLQAMIDNEDSGKLAYRLYYDPALLAAISGAMDQEGMSGDKPILEPEKDLPVEKRPDAAMQRYLNNQDDWDTAFERVTGILLDSETKQALKEMSNYSSCGYMADKDGDKTPEIIVLPSQSSGGHFVVFTLTVNGKERTLRLRLECGFQPVDIPEWPVPEPDPPPKKKLTPKDPNNDPQRRPDADKYDFFSKDEKNNEPDTTVTTEPESPTEYQAPEPPTEEEVTEAEKQKEPDASTGTQSGSKVQDEQDGSTEQANGKDYTVSAGNGQNNGDINVIADSKNQNKPKVEEPIADQGTQTEEISGFE